MNDSSKPSRSQELQANNLCDSANDLVKLEEGQEISLTNNLCDTMTNKDAVEKVLVMVPELEDGTKAYNLKPSRSQELQANANNLCDSANDEVKLEEGQEISPTNNLCDTTTNESAVEKVLVMVPELEDGTKAHPQASPGRATALIQILLDIMEERRSSYITVYEDAALRDLGEPPQAGACPNRHGNCEIAIRCSEYEVLYGRWLKRLETTLYNVSCLSNFQHESLLSHLKEHNKKGKYPTHRENIEARRQLFEKWDEVFFLCDPAFSNNVYFLKKEAESSSAGLKDVNTI